MGDKKQDMLLGQNWLQWEKAVIDCDGAGTVSLKRAGLILEGSKSEVLAGNDYELISAEDTARLAAA
eukprot:108615-Chlamydomonas_euryale.AAC.1